MDTDGGKEFKFEIWEIREERRGGNLNHGIHGIHGIEKEK
jgi:hypothetical protein